MAKSGIGVKFPHGTMATPFAKGMIILAGSSSPELAKEVARHVNKGSVFFYISSKVMIIVDNY